MSPKRIHAVCSQAQELIIDAYVGTSILPRDSTLKLLSEGLISTKGVLD
jgi:hypothetical protein